MPSARRALIAAALLPVLADPSCTKAKTSGPPAGGAPLVLAAGVVRLSPSEDRAWADGVDGGRLGLGKIDAVYAASTPAGVPFAFDVLARSPGNSGGVRVSPDPAHMHQLKLIRLD